MKIGVIGGSFNPLHIGHAMLADTLVRELGYDKVLFVPTFIPPHKQISEGATTEQRMQMVKAFCDSVPGGIFEMEPCEIERGGVSYTVDTMKYLLEKYKGQLTGKIGFALGSEVAAEFHKWKEPDVISQIADLVVVPRYPDYVTGTAQHKNIPTGHYKGDFNSEFNSENFKYNHILLKNPILPLSSTEIRTRIAEGRSFEYLVPKAIYDYIQANKLYK